MAWGFFCEAPCLCQHTYGSNDRSMECVRVFVMLFFAYVGGCLAAVAAVEVWSLTMGRVAAGRAQQGSGVVTSLRSSGFCSVGWPIAVECVLAMKDPHMQLRT